MKNSDMKVIAIILSIALFFTIVTSNAVSIASVVFLAKGETATEGTVGEEGTATTPDAGTATTPGGSTATTPGGSTATPETTAPAGTATTPGGSTATTPSGSTATTPDVTQPAGDAGEKTLSSDEAFKMFQKAANDIATKGTAGYTKKAWQSIEGELALTAESSFVNALLGALKGTLTNLITGFMTSEADATEDVSAKGSEDSMNRFPDSNCTMKAVQNVSVTTSGSNYVITIVMKDQINPAKADTDGLRVMSKDILYMEDVVDTIQNDSTVSAVVKELHTGEINYKAYTIKATMTKDGKFVSVDHDCTAALVAKIDAVGVGVVTGSGSLGFHTRYTNFKY